VCDTGQPAVEEEVHSDNDSVKVRIKLKGRKSESSSFSVRKNVKKLSKKLHSEDDEVEEGEVCNSCAGRRAVFGIE
jgi:translation initiation factor IF-3